MKETTIKKPVKAIQSYLKECKFDLVEIIYEKDNAVIVAFGHKNSKYNELKYYDKNLKRLKTLFIDGEHSFYEFVRKTKLKYQKG